MFGFLKKKKTANIMSSSRSAVERICKEDNIILPDHDQKPFYRGVRRRTLELDGKTLALFDGKENALLFCRKSILLKKNKHVNIDGQPLSDILLSPDAILKSPAAIEKMAITNYNYIKVDILIIVCPPSNNIGKMSVLYHRLANSIQAPKNFKEQSDSIMEFLNTVTHGNCEIDFNEVIVVSHDDSGVVKSFLSLRRADIVALNRKSIDKQAPVGSTGISDEIGK